jgi:hypothetical protein
MKKALVTFLKVAVSLAILAYLIWNSTRGDGKDNAFANLLSQPKRWSFFAAAWAVGTVAVVLTFVRWWYLVRAIDIPCRLRDALRIGFWGYLFNLAPLGIVGGDMVKAMMLAHEQPRHRGKSVASVLVDRVTGLYLLFVVASVAIFLNGFWSIPTSEIHHICQATIVLTVVGTLGIAAMFVPAVLDGKLVRTLGRLPRAGRALASLFDAVRMYRGKPKVLVISSVMSVGVHCLFAASIYLVARGLLVEQISLGSHLVIVPLSNATGVLPLLAGPFEFVLEFLYTHVPLAAGASVAAGQGLVIALCYRLITVLIAAAGAPYYFGNRAEVRRAIHNDEPATAVPFSAGTAYASKAA